MSDPVAPTGVRIEYADGSELPVEMVYVGLDEEGLHLWENISPVAFTPATDAIMVDNLPGKTAILINLPVEDR